MNRLGWSGGDREAIAGQAQIDVVQGRRPRVDSGDRQSGGVHLSDGVAGAAVVYRHRERRADGEGVVLRDSAGLKQSQGVCPVTVDPKLDDLAPQLCQERPGAVESDDLAAMDD